MKSLASLPTDVVVHVLRFLLLSECIPLYSTCVALFALKAQHHYFHLSIKYSGEYLFNIHFRKLFATRYSPSRLHVQYPIAEMSEPMRLRSMDSVIRNLEDVHSLTFTTETITTAFNPLGATRLLYRSFNSVWACMLPRRWELRFCHVSESGCRILATLPNLEYLGAGSAAPFAEVAHWFQHIPCIDLSRTELKDATPLAKCQKLNLEWNFKLQDVSMLANVQELYLNFCYGIRDVSALGKVRHLELNSCLALERLDGLGVGNQFVSLQNCSRIRDYAPLATVPALQLDGSNIVYVSRLQNVQRLSLRHCKHLDNVSVRALAHVPYLDLSFTFLQDYSLLGNDHQMLRLCNCRIKDVTAFAGVPYLELADNRIEDVSALGGCKWLDVRDNPIRDVSALANVQCLSIAYCPVADLRPLTGVQKLCVVGVSYPLGHLRQLGQLKLVIIGEAQQRRVKSSSLAETIAERWKPQEFFDRNSIFELNLTKGI